MHPFIRAFLFVLLTPVFFVRADSKKPEFPEHSDARKKMARLVRLSKAMEPKDFLNLHVDALPLSQQQLASLEGHGIDTLGKLKEIDGETLYGLPGFAEPAGSELQQSMQRVGIYLKTPKPKTVSYKKLKETPWPKVEKMRLEQIGVSRKLASVLAQEKKIYTVRELYRHSLTDLQKGGIGSESVNELLQVTRKMGRLLNGDGP